MIQPFIPVNRQATTVEPKFGRIVLMGRSSEEMLQRVRLTASDPSPWYMRALTLQHSAQALWEAANPEDRAITSITDLGWVRDWAPPIKGGRLGEVCFMLLGFALENLAKGVIVSRDPKLVSKERLSNWHGQGHNLIALFEWAKISVTDDERKILDRTTRVIEWKGRYPVPMDFYEVGPQDHLLEYIAAGDYLPSDEYDGLTALYDKAEKALVHTMNVTTSLPKNYDFGDG
jgi:hypothetical protein